jgi:hypothetical protein
LKHISGNGPGGDPKGIVRHSAVAAMEPLLAVAITAAGLLAVTEAGTPLDGGGWAALTLALMLAARTVWGGVELARLEMSVLPMLVVHALVFPAVYAVLGFTRLPLGEGDVRRALLSHLAFLGGAWGALAVADLVWLRPAPMAALRYGVPRWAAQRPWGGRAVVAGVALTAGVASLLYALSTGYFFAFGGADRRQVYLATGEEQLWYVRYAIQGVLLWSLASGFGTPSTGSPIIARRDSWLRWGSLGGTVLYVVATLGIGGRRDIIGVLLPLAVLGWMVARGARARALVLGALGTVLLGLFAFAAIRTWNGSRSIGDLLTLYDLLAEFLFPWQVTGYLAANPPQPLMGASYLYPFVLWIPRSAWPGKPVILAEQFSVQAGVADQLGFGFSPVAEAVWNFGVELGPWLGGVGVVLLLRAVSARAGAWPLLYLAAVGRLLSVPRSELASVGGELLVLLAAFVGCDLLASGVTRVGAWRAGPRPGVLPGIPPQPATPATRPRRRP